MKKYVLVFLLILYAGQALLAQSTGTQATRKYVNEQADNIMREFINFLAIPNIAKDTVNIQKNTVFIMDMMTRRGIEKVQLLNAATAGAPPAIYGEVNVPGAKQTLVFYAHYDGQPVNPSQWTNGLAPF